jgi:hypothetical protein
MAPIARCCRLIAAGAALNAEVVIARQLALPPKQRRFTGVFATDHIGLCLMVIRMSASVKAGVSWTGRRQRVRFALKVVRFQYSKQARSSP